MNRFIGIDLGTSSVKLMLVDSLGNIIKVTSRDYQVYYPQANYSEQDPNDWYNSAIDGLKELIADTDKTLIKGISFAGQMHGLVILDENDEVIRRCILWNDGRTEKQVEYLNNVIGKAKLSQLTGNIAFAGFTAPKILWVKENEPENFSKIKKIMLPKDYLAYKFSGVYASDYSDASGTLYLDVKNKCYSKEMCEILGITNIELPRLFESYESIGNITDTLANELGLNKDCKVIIGAGDNAAASIGTGNITEGMANVSIGTSGTIFIPLDNFVVDDNNSLHSFCHSNGKYHLMGCILSAASCRNWWLEGILNTSDFAQDEQDIKNANNSDLIFLPYLTGERSPHNDVFAKGAFVNITINTTKGDMSKAILEGVSFALRDSLEVAKKCGIKFDQITLCGGGARSNSFIQIIADVFNMPISLLENEQGPSFGASILAMVGTKEYNSVKDACDKLVKIKRIVYPNKDNVLFYEDKYQKFRKLYPLLKEIR